MAKELSFGKKNSIGSVKESLNERKEDTFGRPLQASMINTVTP